MSTPQAISLLELNTAIREIIDDALLRTWVVGEISEIRQASGGHIYLTLVEKSSVNGNVVARLQCHIWSRVASSVIPEFVRAMGSAPTAGMKIMVLVEVTFHEVYGLAGNITAIEPMFTLGEMERKRRETIARLQAEGVSEMNKELPLPTTLLKIAVVSAVGAAGLGDFAAELKNDANNFRISCTLFAATMQGEKAAESIVDALDRIALRLSEFDCVVLIRGGGSRADLACFDEYDLAVNIAQFPLPVLTGIGHERDTSVCDMVACRQLKTPTAVADFIIAHNIEILLKINELTDALYEFLQMNLDEMNVQLEQMQIETERVIEQAIILKNNQLETQRTMLRSAVENLLQLSKIRIENSMQQLAAVNPTEVLKRGFTMTFVDGLRVTSPSDVCVGDEIMTVTRYGMIRSKVE